MAKLTPLAKGFLTAASLGVAGAAAWHLGLKERLGPFLSGETQVLDATDISTPAAGSGGRPGSGNGAHGAATLGSATKPLKVSIVSFHGYAPALLANGRSLKTQPASTFARSGVHVEFVIQDDIPTLATIFGSNTAQCAWRTSDFWAQEQPNLRNAGFDARAVMVVDNTQGGDAVIAKEPAVQSIEDLAGRRVALLQYTPSDGMVIDAVDNSALSARKKKSIDYVYINVDEGTAGVRAAFESGRVDAAALWDPDLSLALKNVPGAHVIYSTRTATNLIYDVIVCDTRILTPENDGAIMAFVKGWMEGVQAARNAPDDAVDALERTEEFFALLIKDQGRDFVKGLFENLVWTGIEDNARILGLTGGPNHYERVYKRFDQIYRRAGALANPKSPVINPQDSFDYRFVKRLLAERPDAQAAAREPQFVFTAAERDRVADRPASLTKPVTVRFKSGSARLSKRSQRTIDDEMVPLIENNGSAYFEVSGNTDSTGSRRRNMRLSRARADAVVRYLTDEWEFERERFVVVGNGPNKPLCKERRARSEGMTRKQCRAVNRSTRLAILAR